MPDRLLKLTSPAIGTVAEVLVRQGRELAFDLVEPGRGDGREVQTKARMPSKPTLDRGCLVGAVVEERGTAKAFDALLLQRHDIMKSEVENQAIQQYLKSIRRPPVVMRRQTSCQSF